MKDFSKITLGELLTHTNEIIRRNSLSILKTLQKLDILPQNMIQSDNKGRAKDEPNRKNNN